MAQPKATIPAETSVIASGMLNLGLQFRVEDFRLGFRVSAFRMWWLGSRIQHSGLRIESSRLPAWGAL